MLFKKLTSISGVYMLRAKFAGIATSIFAGLLPPLCVLCGYYSGNGRQICRNCRRDLPRLPSHCRQCAEFLYGQKITHCGLCLNQPPPFDFTHALFPYEWPITAMIIKLKFQHQLCHAKALSELMIWQIQNQWYRQQPLPDCIVPVPLHATRLQERGFNQALEIAKPIARVLHLPMDIKGIQRIKPTATQSSLSATQRQKNIAHAFVAQRDYSGLHVALLDDVITTGHTVRECSRILKEHGAKRIDVWCCARRG